MRGEKVRNDGEQNPDDYVNQQKLRCEDFGEDRCHGANVADNRRETSKRSAAG